jgi:ERF superfamily
MSQALQATQPTEVAPRAPSTPMDMLATALERGMSTEVLGQLMALQERWQSGQARQAFDAAIAAAKAKIKPIVKNRKVDFTSAKGRTNYEYEDLGEIARSVDPILAEFGLSYRFRSNQDGRQVTITCIMSHRDGFSEENSLSASTSPGTRTPSRRSAAPQLICSDTPSN